MSRLVMCLLDLITSAAWEAMRIHCLATRHGFSDCADVMKIALTLLCLVTDKVELMCSTILDFGAYRLGLLLSLEPGSPLHVERPGLRIVKLII
jgi:hypothetical protein